MLIHSLEAHRLGDGLGDGLGPKSLRMLSHRAILLSKPGDVVIVDSEPDADWIHFLKIAQIETGLVRVAHGSGDTLAQQIRSDQSLMAELSNRRWVIEPYMGGEEIEGLAKQLQSELHAPESGLLDRLNLKSNLEGVLEDAGLPTIPALVAMRDQVLQAALTMMNDLSSVIVRSDLSIGGHGVWIVKQESDIELLAAGIARSEDDRLFVLQPLYSVTSSPNVQYEITRAGPQMLGVSDQQMTQNYAFGGNLYPSNHQQNTVLLDQANRIARWLGDAGYLGVIGIDFIVTDDGEIFIVEINPRVNTSTFPLLLSKRLGCGAFELLTGIHAASAEFSGFAEMIGPEILFDKRRGTGVVPLMMPRNGRRLIDAMVFGHDLRTVKQLRQRFIKRIQRNELIGGGS